MMGRAARLPNSGLAVLALCVGCRSESVAAALPSAAPSVQLPTAAAPSFKRDVLPTITLHCADANGRHGAEPTDSVSLDLTPGAAHRELVNHRSEVRKDALRGSAGDPDHGFLLDELAGRLQHDEGKRMPLDADTGVPLEPSPITLAFIDTALVPWIRAGAKDD